MVPPLRLVASVLVWRKVAFKRPALPDKKLLPTRPWRQWRRIMNIGYEIIEGPVPMRLFLCERPEGE
jgi:hypothetical protein